MKTHTSEIHQPCGSNCGRAWSRTWRNLALPLLLLAAVHTASAQSLSIGWFKIGGGGGTSAGGGFALSGTIGQPDASGPLTNGQYSVRGGFWTLPVAVQMIDAPTLTTAPAGPGQ